MAEMSPLARLLMSVLRAGAVASAVALVAASAILLWQRWTPAGPTFQKGDAGFLAVLGALFLLAAYLVRGIGKELQASASSPPEERG